MTRAICLALDNYNTSVYNHSLKFRCVQEPFPNNMPSDQIQYSDKYCDDEYEYRHVILPQELAKLVPRTHLMTETEWRNLGVQQSPGWIHYMLHNPEPHILLFRRTKPENSDANTWPVSSQS